MLRIFGRCPNTFARVFIMNADDTEHALNLISDKLNREMPGCLFNICED